MPDFKRLTGINDPGYKKKAPGGFLPPGAHSLTAYLLIVKQLALSEC
jgi:hypothetical protein